MTIPVAPNPVSSTNISHRRQLLQEAAKIVDGQRDKEYGGPEQSFNTIAALWSVMKDTEYTTADVALMMAAVKLARLSATNGHHHDSWVDLAGYAACGYEVTQPESTS